MSTSRRMFLKGAAMAGAPFILPSHIWAAETGPNDRIVMGCIGMGTQLRYLMNGFMHQDGVQIAAVCDVDTTRRKEAQRVANEYYGQNPTKGTADVKAYNDFREIIARKDINAVVIATPDHWHAIIMLAALNAGKDVYCEKPLTHNVIEAIEVFKTAEKTGRIVQTGSMQRSSPEFRVACELVRNGVIGKIKHVVTSFGGPANPYNLKEEEMEPGLDWNMWLGPAQMAPYNPQVCPRGNHTNFPAWRHFREFGGGGVTDWGAHHLDIANWGLDMDQSGPVEIVPEENKNEAMLTYPNGVKVYHKDHQFGCEFFGENGVVQVNRGRFTFTLGNEKVSWFAGGEDEASKGTSCEAQVRKAEKAYLADAKVKLYASKHNNHLVDFLECVRSRKQPCTNAETGGRTAIACNLLNQAYYNRKKIIWDPKALKLGGDGDPKWLTREYRAPFKV